VVIGLDGKALLMSGQQFGAYVRLNHRVGDRVTFDVLREGRRVGVSVQFGARKPP